MNQERFYKFTNKESNHNGFQYQEGINTDVEKWNTRECSSGGLYIVPIKHWTKWANYRDDLYYVWDVEPIGSLVSHERGHKTKCHQIRLWNKRPISEMVEQLDVANQLRIVKLVYNLIRYISNPSEEVQLAAVQQCSLAIQLIANPSVDVQLAAVQRNECAIRHIKNPFEEVQLLAVQLTGHVIVHINNPSEEVQLAAVKQNGYNIQYIRNPSEVVQRAAIKQDALVAFYIKRHFNCGQYRSPTTL